MSADVTGALARARIALPAGWTLEWPVAYNHSAPDWHYDASVRALPPKPFNSREMAAWEPISVYTECDTANFVPDLAVVAVLALLVAAVEARAT